MTGDLMFEILRQFSKNKDFKKIAVAMDAAFLIGHKRAAFTPIADEQALIMMKDKCKKLGLHEEIKINDITT